MPDERPVPNIGIGFRPGAPADASVRTVRPIGPMPERDIPPAVNGPTPARHLARLQGVPFGVGYDGGFAAADGGGADPRGTPKGGT